MWTCIGFLVYFTATQIWSDDVKSVYIGTYASDQVCMVAGQKWAEAHRKSGVQADFSCEKDIYQGVEL